MLAELFERQVDFLVFPVLFSESSSEGQVCKSRQLPSSLVVDLGVERPHCDVGPTLGIFGVFFALYDNRAAALVEKQVLYYICLCCRWKGRFMGGLLDRARGLSRVLRPLERVVFAEAVCLLDWHET